jgi:16S rRNA (guanine527-N7)-methyltransferase
VPPPIETAVPFPGRSLPESLIEALRRAQTLGFLGPGPLDAHIAHAHGFAAAAEALAAEALTGVWMDLGTGGGIPGLVLAGRWPEREAVLLDSNQRRARFLADVVESQGWGSRVRIVSERAEAAGRVDALRAQFSLVVARSFGPPPVTAECAAPFLLSGGILIVSEPPLSGSEDDRDDTRWPPDGLAPLGLEPLPPWRGEFGYRVLRQTVECPERFPRRVGVPSKRPLYRVADDGSQQTSEHPNL